MKGMKQLIDLKERQQFLESAMEMQKQRAARIRLDTVLLEAETAGTQAALAAVQEAIRADLEARRAPAVEVSEQKPVEKPEPEPPKPREVWVNVYPSGTVWNAYDSREVAVRCAGANATQVLFREVLAPQEPAKPRWVEFEGDNLTRAGKGWQVSRGTVWIEKQEDCICWTGGYYRRPATEEDAKPA